MVRQKIPEYIKRRLYAESIGRCMNPKCQRELLRNNGDIFESAHIISYSETKDNSFDNLVILCPNCHTDYDKNKAFTSEELRSWKTIREKEIKRIFGKKYENFEDMQNAVTPLLYENKLIYEKYYLGNNKILWDKMENKLLINNRKIKEIFINNFHLIQRHNEDSYSNLHYVNEFLLHVEEFESTRQEKEKMRGVFFPKEILSIFGIDPVNDTLFACTESLELLIEKLKTEGKFESISIGTENPYLQMMYNGESSKLYLNDVPRLRQFYYNYGCFRKVGVRLGNLNFALKYINSKGLTFSFLNQNNLREIILKGYKMKFVYEYCLSKANLLNMVLCENDIVVNLHNWNGESCISQSAYDYAKEMKVRLMTIEAFYKFIHAVKKEARDY